MTENCMQIDAFPSVIIFLFTYNTAFLSFFLCGIKKNVYLCIL